MRGPETHDAGASARAEYDRRRLRDQQRVRRLRVPVFAMAIAGVVVGLGVAVLAPAPYGPLGWTIAIIAPLLALSRLLVPQTTLAWKTGAEGEERTAELLEPLRAEGFEILHDRKMPSSKANIDHIVIGPPGLFVVETKSLGGQVRVRDGELYVNGRRNTNSTIDEARREAAVVAGALGPELDRLGLSVQPILCVHRADLPLLFGRELHGVPIRDGRGLVKDLRKRPQRLDPDQVAALARVLGQRLKPALVPAPDPADLVAPPDQLRHAPPRPAAPAVPPKKEERLYWRRGKITPGEMPVPERPPESSRPPHSEGEPAAYPPPDAVKSTHSSR